MERCMACRSDGCVCVITEKFHELQNRVPKKPSLDELGELNNAEKSLHEEARERGCLQHNNLTLKLPRFTING